MSAYLGPMLGLREVYQAGNDLRPAETFPVEIDDPGYDDDFFNAPPDESLARSPLQYVRAWRVPRLIGMIIECEREEDVAASLVGTLATAMPGTDWQLVVTTSSVHRGDSTLILRVGDVTGPLRRYGILHALVDAPPDATTGQPMVLELSGVVTQAGHFHWDPFTSSWHERLSGVALPPHVDRSEVPLEGPLKIRIDGATYSNTTHLGVDVPFYM
jgi:hypothetical protein